MQIWDGKTWQKLADIPKPPLWEIDNFGRPFVFKPPLEAMGLVTTARPPEQQQEAEEDFVNRFGISLPALVSICLGVGICGLLCLCVLCPILASPRTLNIFRMNAPERMDAKKMKQLDSILKMKREVKNLETQVQDHATTTDDWGMSHKVQSEEQRMLERQLDRKRKQQAKMERTAESGEQKEVKKEEQVQRKRADDERYRRMKEAYRPKTVAVDGVALRAPESVLLELGFEPEALEAFSMPGFSSMDADGNLVAAPEDEEEEEALENEDETGPPPPPDDEASEEAFDLAALQEAARNAKFDDAALRMPPELDEAPNIAREGAGLKRRGAMAGPKDGQPMDAELLKRAQRKAAGLKVGAEIHEENEVDKWIGPGSEPSSSRPDTSRSQASNAQLLDWDALDVDKEALKKEKIREQAKATLAKQRLRAITEGDKKDAAAAAESDDSQDEDIEVKLGRAAAPMAEGALMSVFIKKEPVKATREAREVQEPVAEPEELALPVPVPEVRAAGDAHETAAASSAAGSQQPYQGKVHGLSELPGCADDADQRRLAMGPLPLDEAALPDSGGEGRSRQIAEADGLLPADVRRRWGRSRRPRGGGRAWGRSIKAYEPLIPSGARSAQTAAKPQSRKAAHRVGRQGETSLVFVIWSLRVEPSAKRAFSESHAGMPCRTPRSIIAEGDKDLTPGLGAGPCRAQMYSMDGPGHVTYTRGCLSQMLHAHLHGTLDLGIKPVLIVKASAKIGNDQKRWSLTLCDGVHVVKSVVVSEMARRLEEAQGNVIGLLLRLDKYGFATTDKNSQILTVLEFTTVGRAGPHDYDVTAENIPSTQALHEEHSARFANGASRMATFGQVEGGNCGVADAPTQPGYVEAPAGPPANPYAMPPGGPYGGSANPYANQSTASVPRPVETARNLSTSLAPVSSVGAVTPVSALNAYTGGRWKIKDPWTRQCAMARVLTKGDVRKFNNQRGEGQLFKVDLGDKTGEISATFFGRAVDKYYSLLKPEKVYTFQKGQIKPANKRYDRGDHVLVFEEHALIEAAGEDEDIPKISYDFRDLASVETLQPETHIDVKAVIFHMQEPFTFTAKTSNKEMTKRVLHLWDTSGDPASGSTCELTLWGDTALSSEFEINQEPQGGGGGGGGLRVIFLKKARVSEFNGAKSLSSPAGMQHSPDHPQAFALIRSYQQLQQTNPQAFQARTNWGSSTGRRQTIEELRQEDIGLGAPPTPWQQPAGPGEPKSIHRHWVVATMTNLPMDRPPYYTACPHVTEASQPPTSAGQPSTRTCNKKVTQDGDGMWMCASGHKSQQPDFRYLCRLTVLDHTDKCEEGGTGPNMVLSDITNTDTSSLGRKLGDVKAAREPPASLVANLHSRALEQENQLLRQEVEQLRAQNAALVSSTEPRTPRRTPTPGTPRAAKSPRTPQTPKVAARTPARSAPSTPRTPRSRQEAQSEAVTPRRAPTRRPFEPKVQQPPLLGCIVMAVAIAILAMLAEVMAEEATSSAASLRGASAARELQQTPADQVPVRDSEEAVAPRCLPGYVDVTGGQAFFWSCAFHCDGGQYYATASCMCACLTPEQRDRLETQGDAGFISGGTGTGQSSGILITARSTIGPPPAGDPVVEIPIGPLGGDGRPGVAPPAVDSYVMKQRDEPVVQAETSSDEEEGNLSLAVIALIGGLLLVIAASVALICALWSSLAHGKPRRTKVMVQLPRFSPHVPVEKCPQPPAELRSTPSAPTLTQAVHLQEPAIRVSWNSSNVSGESRGLSRPAQWQHLRVPDGDRKLKGSPSSSKTSANSTCSGGTSGTSSLSSSSWAIKSEQGGRSLGTGKSSRVHPSAKQVFM
eukprot:s1728_g11.t3